MKLSKDKLRKAIKVSLKLREESRLRGSKRSIEDAVKLAILAKTVVNNMEKSGLIKFNSIDGQLVIVVRPRRLSMK